MGSPTSAALFIRADASAQIGTGHVMRMLALAQAWQRAGAGPVVFLCAQLPAALADRLRSEPCTVVELPQAATPADDARATLAAIGNYFQLSDVWLVADGYHFGGEFQQVIKAEGVRLLVMDDNGENADYVCDLVLNQNIHADEKFYARRAAHTRLLLGTRHVLLRKEFLAVERRRDIPTVARRLLVTMGGADPGNMTGMILDGLAQWSPEEGELCVVLGGSNPRADELERQARALPWSKVRVRRNATNMPELIRWADMAVTAGGSTCWELCLLGLPMLVISIAENQRALVQALGAAGAAVVVGQAGEVKSGELVRQLAALSADAGRRQTLSAAAQRVVDGWGAERVVAALRGEELFLRPATMEDAERLWRWANDPLTRAVSFRQDPIPWDTHVAWLQSKLAHDRVQMLMAETGTGLIGVIRFELEAPPSAVVSVTLAPEARGRGWGAKLIVQGTHRFAAVTGTTEVHAFIKPDNRASVVAFERAGYGPADETVMAGAPALQRVWRQS